MNILLLGPQGSGKGTQAKRISEEHGVPQISTGDMFRAAIAAGSELGRRVEPILASGALVPDELTIALIRERLGEPDAQIGFILDGFPRNLAQAEVLDELLEELDRPLSVVFEFLISDEECVLRLTRRAHLEGRADDTPEAIAKRLQIYHEQTEPVIRHYVTTGKVVGLHAERSEDEVFAEIQEALENVQAPA